LHKEFIEGDFEFLSKKQQVVWLRGNYYPVTDKRGKITKIMHLATDITEEMKQDEKVKARLLELEAIKSNLSTQNQRLEALTSAFQRNLATIDLSPDGEILEVNDKFCEKICLSRKELVGKHHRHLFDEAFLASDGYRNLWICLHRAESVELHHHGLRLAYQPLKDDTGNIVRILGIVLGC
jgi:methyl-accepting chemotaxis protein